MSALVFLSESYDARDLELQSLASETGATGGITAMARSGKQLVQSIRNDN